jgi:hypothetical protein
LNHGTRSDGEPYRLCDEVRCTGPAHISNCFRCAGYGEMVLASGATTLVTAAQASRGDLPQLAIQFLRCRACGSDFRGVAGLSEDGH